MTVKISDFAANARLPKIVRPVCPVSRELAVNNLAALITIVRIQIFQVATVGLNSLLITLPVSAIQQPLSVLKTPQVKPA
jgi:hypothetical protein